MNQMIKRLTVATLVGAAAACSNPGGPDQTQDQFNTRRVRDGVATIEQVNSSPVLQSFRALGGRVATVGAGPSAAVGADRLAHVIRDLAAMTSGPNGPALIPVIRPQSLGKTFVYDPATKQYVVSNRSGAPANGVRFILYQEEAGQVNPAKEIGYADLTDEKASSSTSAGLRLKAVADGKTFVDYTFDVTGSLASATVTVKGFLSDGTERVNFDLATSGQLGGRGGTVTINAKIEVPSKQFSIEATLVGKNGEEQGAGQYDLTVRSGSDVLVLNAKASATEVDAKVTANGKLFATIKGSPSNPTIKGEGGRDLTAEELAALGELYEFAEGVYALIADLLAPAGVLLAIGLGL